MAAILPQPWRRGTQQSANMMRDKSMLLKLCVDDASCLCLPVVAAASGKVWPANFFGNPSSGKPEANVHTQELRGLCLDRDF